MVLKWRLVSYIFQQSSGTVSVPLILQVLTLWPARSACRHERRRLRSTSIQHGWSDIKVKRVESYIRWDNALAHKHYAGYGAIMARAGAYWDWAFANQPSNSLFNCNAIIHSYKLPQRERKKNRSGDSWSPFDTLTNLNLYTNFLHVMAACSYSLPFLLLITNFFVLLLRCFRLRMRTALIAIFCYFLWLEVSVS